MLNKEVSVEDESTGYVFHVSEAKGGIYMMGSEATGNFSALSLAIVGLRQSIYCDERKVAELRQRGIVSTYRVLIDNKPAAKIALGFLLNGSWMIGNKKCGRLKARRYEWELELEERDDAELYLFLSCLIVINQSQD
jgi:hypothetical protein